MLVIDLGVAPSVTHTHIKTANHSVFGSHTCMETSICILAAGPRMLPAPTLSVGTVHVCESIIVSVCGCVNVKIIHFLVFV